MPDISVTDLAFLRLLSTTGSYSFPLFATEEDDLAMAHAETLTRRGLVRRAAPRSHSGVTYSLTAHGRRVFRSMAHVAE